MKERESTNYSRLQKLAAVLAVGGAALAGCTPHAEAAPAATEAQSVSAELLNAWQAITSQRQGRVDVAVFDSRTGQTTSTYNTAGGTYYPASSVKLAIALELFRTNPGAAHDNSDNLRRMITQSDNNATEELFTHISSSQLADLYTQAGTTSTHTTNNSWSGSTTTAADQVRLVNLVAYPNSLIAPQDAATIQNLMYNVASDQRWGVPAGVPPDVAVANKNGWYGDSCNSIGHVSGHGVDYTMAIMSDQDPAGNSTCTYAKETERALSAATWRIMSGEL